MTSGLAMKKFTGNPAAAALPRNVVLPMNPLPIVAAVQPAALAHMNPYGFGFIAARKPRNVAFVQFVPLYRVGSPAPELFVPLKYARKIGSGDVPGAPVYANVLPRPAAMFACRFACAFRNSSRRS